jgi:hypothetical protein
MVGTLGLASLGIANAKSYDITLSDPAMAGSTQLKPGEYKLKVEGSQAIFTDVQSSKSRTAAVKARKSNRKFDETTVESTHQGDMAHIDSIGLAGSNTTLEFGR